MAPIFEPLAPITIRALLIPLGLLLTYLIARGLIGVADQFVRALFGTVSSSVGWIPWVGGKVKGKIDKVRDRLINFLAHEASQAEAKIGQSFHALAQLVTSVGDAIAGIAEAGYATAQYLHSVVRPAFVHATLGRLQHATKAQATADRAARAQAAKDHAAIAHPNAGRIGAAIKHGTRGIDAGLGRLEHWTIPRVRTLEHEVGVSIPGDIAGLRARDLSLGKLYHGLRARLGRLDRATVGLGAAALVVTALARIGAGWIRCNNWRKLGRGVCRANPSFIDELLLGTLLVVGTISITEFARELQGEMELAVNGVHRLVRD